MKRIHSLLAMLLVGLLLASLIAGYLTRGGRSSSSSPRTDSGNFIDTRLLQTAQQLSALADSREERSLSRDALRLADHELDQAFASGLREAATVSTPKTGPLKELADRVAGWNQKIAADQDRIAKLTAQGAAAPAGQLALAKAQLELDQDEMEDAHEDLVRQGGDPRSRVERALQQHEAAEHQTTPPANSSATNSTSTMSDQWRAWSALRDRQRQVETAQDQAASHVVRLEKRHDALDVKSSGDAPAAVNPGDEADTAATVAHLQQLSDRSKSLSDLDKRIQDTQQLVDVYTRWGAAIEGRKTGMVHLLLESVGIVLGILLGTVLIDFTIRRAFERRGDPRRLHQAKVMTTVAVQFAAILLIVLVVFGAPSQVSTIVGLATAGLTVALGDFILSFLGWFALMGRNGIRIGDWVEIRGVGGEVVELGVLKTVLLEVGDSSGTGQPTGRRVSFMNSFAVQGHYFNFSTEGQWVWDELQVSLPATSDPYHLAYQIRDIVERGTRADAADAEKDWERVTHQYGTKPFSGKPVADLRPSGGGFSVIVRYITHAPRRNEVKSALFKEIVEVLHKPAETTAVEPAPAT